MDQKNLSAALEKMLVKLAINRAVKAAVSKLAFLGWPVINPVFAFFVGKAITWLVFETELGVGRLWVLQAVGHEVKSVEEAEQTLRALLADPKKYTAVEAQKIEADFDDKAVDLIRIHDRRV